MDPDEIESILGGGDPLGTSRLAKVIRTARSAPTAAELAREDVDVAAFRREILGRQAQRQRVLSRFTPLKIAAAAAAFVVVGGGFTVALTHTLEHPTTHVVPRQAATPTKAQPTSGSRDSKSTGSTGTGSKASSSSATGSNTPASGQTSTAVSGGGTSKQGNGNGDGNNQGQGATIAPGLTGSAVPASYRGLCVSYQDASSQAQAVSKSSTEALHKLQKSTKFMRLAESALNQGLTVPQFCSKILGTSTVSPSVPGFGLNSTTTPSTNSGSTSTTSAPSNSGDQTGGGSSGTGRDGGGGGIVSAGIPAK